MDLNKRQTESSINWSHRLLRVTWWCILIVFLLEFAYFVIVLIDGSVSHAVSHLYRMILRPGVINVAIMTAVTLLSRQLFRQPEGRTQATVYLTGVSLIVMNVVWAHRVIPTASAAFLIPMVLAILYTDRRMIGFAFGLNLGLYGLHLLLLDWRDPTHFPRMMTVTMTVGILLTVYCISILVVDRQRALMEDVIVANRNSMRDSLTRLFNHAAFYEQLDEKILAYGRGEGDFCLIVFDIDDFKQVNDLRGHDVGDEILLTLVAAINAAHTDGDMAFRYGGEEFTILTDHTLLESLALADAIRIDFTARVKAARDGMRATVSVGICQYDPTRFRGRREFFAAADEALYEAKRTGKNRAVLWTEKLLERPHGKE